MHRNTFQVVGTTPPIVNAEFMQALLDNRGLSSTAADGYAHHSSSTTPSRGSTSETANAGEPASNRLVVPIPPEIKLPHLQIAQVGSSTLMMDVAAYAGISQDFDVVIQRVMDLHQADEDDPNQVPPTDHAFFHILDILFMTYMQIGSLFPRASVNTDDDGGISLFWTKPGRSVQLTIAGDQGNRSYIQGDSKVAKLAH